MLVQRWQDIEEYDLGSILGKPELGVKVKRITSNSIGGRLFKYNFNIEHYILESGKSYHMANNQHTMIVYIISGFASFNGETQSMQAEKGDIVYLGHKELQHIDNTSKEPLEILCCVDRQN
jgi:mannose-6-phosphate isomerase-like protein (cupin superfamily)